MGEVINNRYQILAPLSGAVYRAHDLSRDLLVAVKEIRASADQSSGFVMQKFRDEVKTLTRLEHPQIPRILDYFALEDSYIVVMELIQGDSLALSVQPLPDGEVVEDAIRVCAILSVLHKEVPRPIVHRDVKPRNIIKRDEKADLALVDFGVSGASRSSTIYAPPEVLKGEAEPRSDIYGLGATMFRLLSAQDPPPQQVCWLRKIRPDLRKDLVEVVARATQQAVEHRFANIGEMEAALRQIH